jgi:hypothetical protein
MKLDLTFNELRVIENACRKGKEYYQNCLENNSLITEADLKKHCEEEIETLNELLLKLKEY